MEISVISDLDSAWGLQVEWHHLLTTSQTNHVFMTPEFLLTWWQTEGEALYPAGKLQIVCLRQPNGHLIGLLPLFKEEDTHINLGHRDMIDYFDLIIDQAQTTEAQTQFANWISTTGATLSLHSIPRDSKTRTWAESLKTLQITEQQQDVCPVIQLPSSWDEYLTNLKRKQRHEVRRKWRKLENEAELTFRLIESSPDLAAEIDSFIDLHQKSSPDKAEFWTPARKQFFHDFCRLAAKQGWLKLFFADISGQPAASMLGFQYQQRFYLYNSGYDPACRDLSVGQVLTSYTINDAIETGTKAYDFLRGNEEYKFRLGGVAEPVFDLTIQPI